MEPPFPPPPTTTNDTSSTATTPTQSQPHVATHDPALYSNIPPYYPTPQYPFWMVQNYNGSNEPAGPMIHAGNGLQGMLCSTQPLLVPFTDHDQKRYTDAYMTKVARINRKLARQRSLSLNRSVSSSVPNNSIQVQTRRDGRHEVQNGTVCVSRDLYNFYTPDNKRLRELLKKELKNSDVGSLGRIVLPKREAQENLPNLTDKEGMQIVMRDVYSYKHWSFKYKFWSNNKSRMYVLENTVDFVKQNGLEIGDSLTIYEDESKNLYFSIKKAKTQVDDESSCNENKDNHHHHHLYMYQANRDQEEEASLAILIEQLKHKEQQEEANTLMSLSIDGGTGSSSRGKMRVVDDDHHASFNDYYYTGTLGVLPDPANHYNYKITIDDVNGKQEW
ncbi:TcLEC2 [Tripterygium wilfordii]|uniref:TcLEC2 n=1 Tax=Tripterygium wilfordii TaxID=458696 RepID=A0A7J7C4Q8_TRIWF|nr:B3 domain-containing transcription factor LEC2 [Tripterygium wilfordii]KAF5729098.1 TcLEC2 [Tripterygium wilfordii]